MCTEVLNVLGKRILVDDILLLVVLAAGYLIGAAGLGVVVRAVGLSLTLNYAAMLVLSLPLLCALVTEAMTQMWRHTPGAFGLGGLTVFMPMLVAGLVTIVAVCIAQYMFEPFERRLSRDAGDLTAWVILALGCSAVTLALWRYWPEPRAQLW